MTLPPGPGPGSTAPDRTRQTLPFLSGILPRTILHLRSTHHLTTNFNWYAGLLTEPIMSELQRYILAIVKARAEAMSGVMGDGRQEAEVRLLSGT